MKTFVFGEAMLEYHSRGGTGLRYGGDTLNTAIHMARAGCDVAYVTALGTDPLSDALVDAWQCEGIDTAHVLRHPSRTPGIYAIHLDSVGERSFLYWRDRSAAREMFALPEMARTLEQAGDAALIYFSLITLAVVGDLGRQTLIDLSHRRKRSGAAVAYDSNYRPALWPSRELAQQVSLAAVRDASIGLPTNVDECELAGCRLSESEIAARWQEAGTEEVVVKAGAEGCYFLHQDEAVAFPATAVDVVDSSGAGDAFNAGFLIARLNRSSTEVAIEAGQDLARKTLLHLGAIAPIGH